LIKPERSILIYIFIGVCFLIFASVSNALHLKIPSMILSSIAIGVIAVLVSELSESLSEKLEEPYSSFVLTFSAVTIEIILLSIFLIEGKGSFESIETVKSGILAAVIVDLNVLLGLAFLIGGLSFKEQKHNEDTSGTYSTILIVSVFILFVPTLIYQVSGEQDNSYSLAIAISVLLLVFYIFIYVFQTITHSDFFNHKTKSRIFKLKQKIANNNQEIIKGNDGVFDHFSKTSLISIIIFLLILTAFMAEIFSHNGIYIVKEYDIPLGIAGLVIAMMSVAPEIVTAINAAKNDQMQKVVNIAMGASSASMLLAVPIIVFIAYINGIDFNLNFDIITMTVLGVTVLLVWKNTTDGQTDYLKGISHLVLFSTFVLLLFFMN